MSKLHLDLEKTKKEKEQSSATFISESNEPFAPKIESKIIEVIQPTEPQGFVDTVKSEPQQALPKSKPTKPVYSEPREKLVTTPASILKDLQKAGVITAGILDLFLNVPGVNHRFDHGEHDYPIAPEALQKLATEQVKLMQNGCAIHLDIGPNEFATVQPDKTPLRHLSREEAERYMKLRESLSSQLPACFSPGNFHLNEWTFTSLEDNTAKSLSRDGNMGTLSDHDDSNFTFDVFTEKDVRGFAYGAMQSPRPPPANDGLALQLSMLSVEEVEQMLKTSEEVVNGARKDAEALEKKHNAALKKNKKILKEVC